MIKVLRINNINELLKAATDTADTFGLIPWWRGQAKADWNPIPRLYRRGYGTGTIKYEQSINLSFQRQAKTRYQNCPPKDDLAAWLFLMQHYSLPTRLLDWTESILTALFFAVNEENYSNEPGAIWGLHPYKLNLNQLGVSSILSPTNSKVIRLFDTAFAGTLNQAEDAVSAVISEEVDIRMLVQMAAFTIHGNEKPLNELPNSQDFLTKLEIPAKGKIGVIDALDVLGIRESNLFPDLDHLAKYLAFRFSN